VQLEGCSRFGRSEGRCIAGRTKGGPCRCIREVAEPKLPRPAMRRWTRDAWWIDACVIVGWSAAICDLRRGDAVSKETRQEERKARLRGSHGCQKLRADRRGGGTGRYAQKQQSRYFAAAAAAADKTRGSGMCHETFQLEQTVSSSFTHTILSSLGSRRGTRYKSTWFTVAQASMPVRPLARCVYKRTREGAGAVLVAAYQYLALPSVPRVLPPLSAAARRRRG